MARTELISVDDLVGKSRWTNNRVGRIVARFLLEHTVIARLNSTYRNCKEATGPAFARRSLVDIGVKYRVLNESALNDLPEEGFITVSNHPYGGVDGVMLVDLIGNLRPTYKVMVNEFLMRVESLATSFISVIPYTGKIVDKRSTEGFIKTIRHLRQGNPMGFFPAGAVSFYKNSKEIEDRDWQPTVVRLIQKANVPVIPIYFHDSNSRLFYWIGHYLGWQLRSFFLPREIYNKRGRVERISIGAPIPPEQLSTFESEEALAAFLKETTYQLKKTVK